jgi:hypothetical protein
MGLIPSIEERDATTPKVNLLSTTLFSSYPESSLLKVPINKIN